MLNINYIAKFLSINQDKINDSYYKKIKDFELNNDNKIDYKYEFNRMINNKIDLNLNLNLNTFFNNKIYFNKSPIFTFLNSIFSIANNSFHLYDIHDKEKTIKEFILKIDKELFENNLYNKFGYNLNKKFNKGDIQNALKSAFQFKVTDSFYLFKKYISDYLGINIYIIKKLNNSIDIINSEYYISTRFDNRYHKFLPNFIILEDNNIYKPFILDNEDGTNSILLYSKDYEIIDNLWIILNVKDNKLNDSVNKDIIQNNTQINDSIEISFEKDDSNDKDINENNFIEIVIIKDDLINVVNKGISENNSIINIDSSNIGTNNTSIIIPNKKFMYNDLKHYKIDDLKKLCIENNIDIKKTSEKTNKQINKLKDDLITDLLNL
jgi:hypothetical protein